ncbi:MAG: hypothetical protein KatS3mg119_0095 [Rhodothalassiaceae bacterium]|nr:MAG: hypothetical protein KatS3mg119_0095 [Rhodothalassiaceae bacterium]
MPEPDERKAAEAPRLNTTGLKLPGRDPFAAARARMVRDQLARRGIRDRRVLAAMELLPRHLFVPEAERALAYADGALPIGHGQTISQPFIVAEMLEALALKGDERVLEVGAGSGYAAALLGLLAREVVAIERIPELAARAAAVIADLGLPNVEIRCGDGTKGAPDRAPFDAILVSAGGRHLPGALVAQLAPGGRLVIPLGDPLGGQRLMRFVKDPATGRLDEEYLDAVRFVPLVTEETGNGGAG